jgi:hypothetical protein
MPVPHKVYQVHWARQGKAVPRPLPSADQALIKVSDGAYVFGVQRTGAGALRAGCLGGEPVMKALRFAAAGLFRADGFVVRPSVDLDVEVPGGNWSSAIGGPCQTAVARRKYVVHLQRQGFAGQDLSR